MPTLSELSQTRRTTTAGTSAQRGGGAVSGTAVQPTTTIDNNAAAIRDIGKLLGASVKEHQTASEYAGKRVGTDNLVNFTSEMQDIDNEYRSKPKMTFIDTKQRTGREKEIYDKYMKKGIFVDNDLANQGFKENYGVPATTAFLSQQGANNSLGVKLHTEEEVNRVNDEVNLLNGNFNQDNISTWQQALVDVGVDKDNVWSLVATGKNSSFTNKFKDGVDSPNLLPYVDASTGLLTQDGIDRLFNDNYGQVATRENGTYSKVNAEATDVSYDRMKKSFGGWIDNYNKQLTTKSKKLSSTILDTKSRLSVQDSIPAQYQTAMTTSAEQLSQVIKIDGREKHTAEIDALNTIALDATKNRMLISAYSDVFTGAKTYSEAINSDYIYNIAERQVADNVTLTRSGGSIPTSDVKSFIDNKLFKDINAVANSGNIEASANLGTNVALMHSDGYSGGTALAQINNVTESFNSNGFRSASTSGQLLGNLHLVSSYTKTYGNHNTSWVNDRSVALVTAFSENLDQRAETDISLTEEVKTLKLKSFTYTLSREWQSENEGSRKAKFLSDADLIEDDLVSGAVFGDTQLVGGAFDTLLAMGESEQKKIRSEQDFTEYAKEKTMEIDPSIVPIFADTLSMINPLQANDGTTQTRVRKNLQSLIVTDLKDFAGKDIEVDDIADENDISLTQNIGINGELITTVMVFKGRDVIMVSQYRPDELNSGVKQRNIPQGVR